MQQYKQLVVYQESFALANECMGIIERFPNKRRLQEQLFGSVTSVPANLAEFAAMDAKGSQIEKLKRCIAENQETEFWLDFIRAQGLVSEDEHRQLVEKNTVIRKRLFALKAAVEGKKIQGGNDGIRC